MLGSLSILCRFHQEPAHSLFFSRKRPLCLGPQTHLGAQAWSNGPEYQFQNLRENACAMPPLSVPDTLCISSRNIPLRSPKCTCRHRKLLSFPCPAQQSCRSAMGDLLLTLLNGLPQDC